MLASVSGVDFEEAWSRKEAGSLDNLPVYFIGIDDLIRNKKAAGRLKDLADAEALESLGKKD